MGRTASRRMPAGQTTPFEMGRGGAVIVGSEMRLMRPVVAAALFLSPTVRELEFEQAGRTRATESTAISEDGKKQGRMDSCVAFSVP